jgi:DNA-binding MarR family transcriptional regulator
MNQPPTSEQLLAWLAVVRAYNLCDAVLGQRLAELGLRPAEHEVLMNLLRSPGLTQQALAARCFVSKGGISMLVSRLEGAGWLQREADAADARAWRLHLTEAGLALAGRALAVQQAVVTAMVGDASAEELATVTASMQRVSTALEALLEPARAGTARARDAR